MIERVTGFNAAGSIACVIDGEELTVPNDMGNRHRQLIAEWEEQGNKIPPFVDTASPFHPLFPVDFKLGMLTLNVTPDMVDAAIAQLEEPDRTRASIYWTSARMFYRDDVWLALIATYFGKTDDDINGAWEYAMSLSTPVANI
ncbi:hypothetical protein [Rhizobium sp. BK377]|uniref:hypothetical protein n=1 Tax=Rhizobium sp. BK377 TaxID=2587058 RepID=UPI001607E7F7|nr:hypothetical protein [Rhizobium sp. BK377]MBB3461972.1 hypothetical protein [Rhizobium sp. BK377]